MKKFIAILLIVVGCGSLKPDSAPAPIEEGQKRVETIICSSHEVGENGCVFPEGNVSGSLKIYKVYKGSMSILGLGCGVNFNTVYTNDSEWLEIDLKTLVGEKLTEDCVLTLIQKIDYDGQENLPFPIKMLSGTVTLGTCPKGVNCSMSFKQTLSSDRTQQLHFSKDPVGEFALFGCGKELIAPTEFSGELSIPLGGYYEQPIPGGCMFILAVLGSSGAYKQYKKVWYHTDKVINLKSPALRERGRRICYTGDSSVMISSINGSLRPGNSGSFKPREDGDYLRFYTSQGRSLVVFVRNGRIEWTK